MTQVPQKIKFKKDIILDKVITSQMKRPWEGKRQIIEPFLPILSLSCPREVGKRRGKKQNQDTVGFGIQALKINKIKKLTAFYHPRLFDLFFFFLITQI